MRLSELRTGDKGVIVKVMGRGAFRKRIIEMGFIRGERSDRYTKTLRSKTLFTIV